MCTGKFKYSFSEVKDLALFSGANIDLVVMGLILILVLRSALKGFMSEK
jgi:hypothetical protein